MDRIILENSVSFFLGLGVLDQLNKGLVLEAIIIAAMFPGWMFLCWREHKRKNPRP